LFANHDNIKVMEIFILIWLVPLVISLLILNINNRPSRVINEACLALMLVSLPFTFVLPGPVLLKILVAVCHVWLLVLPLRMLSGKLPQDFTQINTRHNSAFGILIACLMAAFVLIWPLLSTAGDILICLLGAAAFAANAIIFRQLLWSSRHFHMPSMRHDLKHLPSVSICVPARNEDHALAKCLDLALASNYPKLEILVYDDDSQDDTAQIIKNFAQSGIRFIAGDTPAVGWLGKNKAMQILTKQASGEYLVFISADTHLETDSITQLVEYSIANSYNMVSVLPQNRLGLSLGTVLPTMQYFWQTVLPVSKHHVPACSKCWLITAESLKALGGFEATQDQVAPESFFARMLFGAKQYRFLMSDANLGITTAKKWNSQVDASIRTSYALCKRSPIVSFAVTAAVSTIFLGPFIACVWLLLTTKLGASLYILAVCNIFGGLNYAIFLRRSQPASCILAIFFLPAIIIQELLLQIASMLTYEFGSISWKGRQFHPSSFKQLPRQHY
jgi:glycosyltransferase involved in cell wall biosynthesis